MTTPRERFEEAKRKILNRIKSDENLLHFGQKTTGFDTTPITDAIARSKRQLAELEAQANVCAASFSNSPSDVAQHQKLQRLLKAV